MQAHSCIHAHAYVQSVTLSVYKQKKIDTKHKQVHKHHPTMFSKKQQQYSHTLQWQCVDDQCKLKTQEQTGRCVCCVHSAG